LIANQFTLEEDDRLQNLVDALEAASREEIARCTLE
jgi:nitrogen-specific signal transduction histidine kinase